MAVSTSQIVVAKVIVSSENNFSSFFKQYSTFLTRILYKIQIWNQNATGPCVSRTLISKLIYKVAHFF